MTTSHPQSNTGTNTTRGKGTTLTTTTTTAETQTVVPAAATTTTRRTVKTTTTTVARTRGDLGGVMLPCSRVPSCRLKRTRTKAGERAPAKTPARTKNLFPSARASCRAERPALRRPQQLAHSNRHAFSSPSGRDKPPPPPGGGRERAHAAIKGEGNKSERIKERERERKTELKLETYFSPPPVASLLLAKFPPLFISQFCLPSVASFSYSASPFPIRPSQYFFGGQRSKCLPFALPSLSQVFTPSSLPFSYPLPQFLTRELIFLYVSLLPPVFFRFFFSSNFHISTRRWRRWRPARERATMFGRFSREREKQERKNDRGNFNTGVKNKKKQYREIHIRRDRRASGTEKTKAENTGERF